MLMVRIRSGIYNNNGQNLDQILVPFTNFLNFITEPKNNIKELIGSLAYDSVLEYAKTAFDECKKIYDIYFTPPQGLFKKIKYRDPSMIEIEKAKSYHKDLITINEKLVEYTNIALQRLHSLDKDKFK